MSPGEKVRRYRWGILATGLACGSFLVAFALGDVPGLTNVRRTGGLIGIYAGAAFLYAAGGAGWLVFTRAAAVLDARKSLER